MFPTPGRWSISARVDGRRHSLGAVVVTAARVRLRSVFGLALHPGGGLLIADGEANRVVRADLQNGRLTTFASNGLSTPTGVAVAPDGTVYVADADARAVFRVAGGGVTRVMQYAVPLDVAVDSQGNLFTTGRENTVIRVDAATGTATRYAGTGEAGSSGNGGPALDARLATPHGITVDPNDNVVIAEDGSVRRIDRATSIIRAIAGSGQRSLCGERGAAFEVCMTAIRVAFEADGDFYVADPENARLWHIADGDAQALNLGFRPFAVVVETETTILLADNPNRRVVRYDVRTGVVETVVR